MSSAADQHAIAATIAEDNKNRRSSKRVANAANGKKQRQEKSKKLKKPLCVSAHSKRTPHGFSHPWTGPDHDG